MNEKIKELAIQSGLPTALDYHQKRYEKFAELIVQECASIDFRHEVGLSSDDDFEISKVIKQHFGVK